MKKISLFTFTILLFASCTDVFFSSPQPSFIENSSEIPEDFQGSFNIGGPEGNILSITDDAITLNGSSLIVGDDNLVVKPWGNYLFANRAK